LTPPPTATEDDAVELEQQLNAYVADNPILFEPTSAVLTDSAFSVLDRLARDAQQFGGIRITVEGHTDSDGVPIENLQLSRNRAEAVRTALIGRGIAAAAVEAVGFGSERPVVVDGVEDKGASRRVEFRVMTVP
jgi:OOP family OmpA-OmpF porin